MYLFVVLGRNFIPASAVFQALNEIAECEGDPEYEDDEMGGGSLLRYSGGWSVEHHV